MHLVMDRLRQNASFVKSLCKNGDCGKILKKATPEQVKTLVDITLNIMKKRIPLSKKGVKFVISKRRELRHILNPKYSLKSKKRFIIQKGGGIFSPLLGLFGRSAAGRVALGAAARGARPVAIALRPLVARGAAARVGSTTSVSTMSSAATRAGSSNMLRMNPMGASRLPVTRTKIPQLENKLYNRPVPPKPPRSSQVVGGPREMSRLEGPPPVLQAMNPRLMQSMESSFAPSNLTYQRIGPANLTHHKYSLVGDPSASTSMTSLGSSSANISKMSKYQAPLVPPRAAPFLAPANTSSYQALATSTPAKHVAIGLDMSKMSAIPSMGSHSSLNTLASAGRPMSMTMSQGSLNTIGSAGSLRSVPMSISRPTSAASSMHTARGDVASLGSARGGVTTAGMQTEAATAYVKPLTSYRQFLEKKGFWNRFKFLAKRGEYEFLKQAPAMAVAGAVTAGISAGVGHGVVKYLEARDKTPQVVIPPALQFDKPTTTVKKAVKINEPKATTRKRDYLASLGTRTHWRYDNHL